MKWYNGFSPSERTKALYVQRKAVSDGQLADPATETCEVCNVPGGETELVMHVEDYRTPTSHVEYMCGRCHGWWHARHGVKSASARAYFLRRAPDSWRCDPKWYGPNGLSPRFEARGPLNRPEDVNGPVLDFSWSWDSASTPAK